MRREQDSGRQWIYDSSRWRQLSAAVLAVQPVCACGAPATMVHHVVPIADGVDPWEPTNLVAVCYRCHMREHRGSKDETMIGSDCAHAKYGGRFGAGRLGVASCARPFRTPARDGG